MGGQFPAGLQQVTSKQDMFDVAASFERRGDYGTLILDRVGRILSCGTPAERIFGASQVRLMGKLISDFVSGLFFAGSSPSFSARYMVHLCADGEWHKYEARDVAGQAFAIELNLARVANSGAEPEMFLLNVRRPEMPADR